MNALVVPAWAWSLLAGVMISLIAIDLLAHRGDRADSKRGALIWTAVWIAAALGFNLFVALYFGAEAGEQFLGAYLLEKSLSIDNLFLFLVIFGALGIPRTEQRRVLTWGILGALIMRAVFIAAGIAMLHRWHWLVYVFGGLLIVTGLKMLRPGDEHGEPKALRWLERKLPWTREVNGHHFIFKRAGRWIATPLLVALIAIELTDVVMALDSVPAAFAVTDEPFLIYSSNVFAVLGLRAMYIVLAHALAKLRYLRFGLAAVLGFAGVKMLASQWLHVPPLVSVLVIAACIGVAAVASLATGSARRARSGRGDPAGEPVP